MCYLEYLPPGSEILVAFLCYKILEWPQWLPQVSDHRSEFSWKFGIGTPWIVTDNTRFHGGFKIVEQESSGVFWGPNPSPEHLLPMKYLSSLLLKLLSQRSLKIFHLFLGFTGSAIGKLLFHFIVLFCRLKPLFTHPLQAEHASTIQHLALRNAKQLSYCRIAWHSGKRW